MMDLRRQKNLSIEALCESCSISRYYYYLLENGLRGCRISLMVSGQLAKGLDIDLIRFYELEKQYQDRLVKSES